jgi:hypothetical protein
MLYLTTAALLGALALRLVRGDGLRHLPSVRCAPLAGAAWLLQLLLFASPLAEPLAPYALAIHALSLLLLGGVVLANRHLPGVSLLALGLVLNVAVMSANAGFMPVAPGALLAAHGPASPLETTPGLRQQKTFLMQSDTPLWFLGDVLPVPPLGKIYSLGDLVAGVGAFILFTSRRTRLEDRVDVARAVA